MLFYTKYFCVFALCAIGKEKGAYKGRKKIERPYGWNDVYKQWKSRELTANKAMEILGLKRNTFYKLISEENN